MAAPLTVLTRRRVRGLAIAGVAVAALLALARLAELSLYDTHFAVGWLLLCLIVGLAAFDLRKRIPVLPLGTASAWQQVHIYAGWFTVATFLLHTGVGLPDGPFEAALWVAFVAVAGSGTVGIWLSRVLPGRITGHGDRELFDRIPVRRAAIAHEVQALAIESAHDTGSVTIADYYHRELQPFFQRPRNLMALLTGYHGHVRRRQQQIEALSRYLDDPGRAILVRIAELAAAKDDLDHQLAVLSALRLWLFVHVPLAYSLLMLSAVHAVLAYAFVLGPS